jgi:protein ImuA
MVRPLATAQDSSPALLRLTLRPSVDGLSVDIVKRRGPSSAAPLSISLQPSPVLFSRHARLPRRSLADVAARDIATDTLV